MKRTEVRVKPRPFPAFAAALLTLYAAPIAHAQRGAGDWMTSGFDAQRSSWVRNDAKISVEAMRKPGFELVWKLGLNKQARQLNALTAPALLDFFIGHRGFRSLAFLGTTAETIVAVDTDLARVEWEKPLASSTLGATGTLACPGGLTSAVTRPTGIAYPPVPTGRGAGRGNPAKSGVGLPFEGAVTLNRPAPPKPVAPPPPPAKPATGRAPAAPPNPFAPRVQYVHAITSDGKFHSLYVSNGEEPKPPMPFLPPNADAHGLVVFNNTAYIATTNECGGVANGVWALDIETQKVTQWKSKGPVAGSTGPAIGPDGTLYVATEGGELVALEEGSLKVKSTYASGGPKFTSSPVVFEHKGKDLIAVATNDGRIHVLDAANLAAPLIKSPAFSTPGFAAGALASWQDLTGTRWLLAPAAGAVAANAGFSAANGNATHGAVVAWKLVDQNGTPKLQPGWMSRDMTSALPPIIVGDVIFALSSGEFRNDDAKTTTAQRVQRSTPAVLYALDSTTGKELWSSGKTITSFVHSGGLSAGGSRVYVGTYDGMQYVFGYPIEH